jgi:uncharacterized protein (DUF1501 family)
MGLSRRNLLVAAGAIGAANLSFPGGAFAQAGASDARFVLWILRGALDGLAAVPAIGDPSYAAARGELALARSGPGAAFALDGIFGLHPSLAQLAARYGAGELLCVHAVATSYRERSHFDAQNLLENGQSRPFARDTGWLNAALGVLPASSVRRELGMALATQAPLCLRGAAAVATWSGSRLPDPNADTLARLMGLYEARDAALAQALSSAQATNQMAAEVGVDGSEAGRNRSMVPVARAAGAFLAAPDGPIAAVIEAGGWDTHSAQGAAQGQLARNLADLDAGLEALRIALGPSWRRTVVVVVTEFGRTVAPNGGGGTDHGMGAAMLLVGGVVAGGRVLADWPGLARANLHDGRELRPTLAANAVLKGVLRDHLGVAHGALDRVVFPDDAGLRPIDGLIRG